MNESYNGSTSSATTEVQAELVSAQAVVIRFTFEGDELDLVRLSDGDVGVVLKRLCDVVGLDSQGQSRRLARAKAAGARWATTAMMSVVAADGKTRTMEVLPRRSIPLWAATVDLGSVREDVRPRVAAYQDRAADVLATVAYGPDGEAGAVRAKVAPEWSEEGMRLRKAEIARHVAAELSPFVSPEVKAVILAHGTAPMLGMPVKQLLPELPAGEWLRPEEIARRATKQLGWDVNGSNVGRAITALGLRGDKDHCRTVMDQKAHADGQVEAHMYDEHAVTRIIEHVAANPPKRVKRGTSGSEVAA